MKDCIAVVGLGYVGLPLLLAFARKFLGTIEFDIDLNKIEALKRGIDPSGEQSFEGIDASKLKITSDQTDLAAANFFVVTAPTPIDPVLLAKTHETTGFDCGKPALNDFLHKYALQNQTSGGARTYVLVRSNHVIGYYSLAPASIMPEDAPERVMKGQGRYPVPVILMARFAHKEEQNKGYGKALYRDALRRATNGAEVIGGQAFLVHAKDEEARTFYLKFGMEESPTNPLLLLLFKDIRQSLNVDEKSASQ